MYILTKERLSQEYILNSVLKYKAQGTTQFKNKHNYFLITKLIVIKIKRINLLIIIIQYNKILTKKYFLIGLIHYVHCPT